jgi:hypothetical protein
MSTASRSIPEQITITSETVACTTIQTGASISLVVPPLLLQTVAYTTIRSVAFTSLVLLQALASQTVVCITMAMVLTILVQIATASQTVMYTTMTTMASTSSVLQVSSYEEIPSMIISITSKLKGHHQVISLRI